MKTTLLRIILITCLLFTVHLLYAQKRSVSSTVTKKYQNGITIKMKGFTVKQALLYVEGGTGPVADDNKVQLNQKVNLYLEIDSGWTLVKGKIYPGISQIVKLKSGSELKKEDDLCKPYDLTGVSPDQGKYIIIGSTVTFLKSKKDHFIINFRVWDKKSKSELTGSYKLYIK